jgi:hypothetical protein
MAARGAREKIALARKEVTAMPTETLATNGRATAESIASASSDEGALRELAIKQAERLRSFKLHAIAFAVGTPILGAIWVLTEYFEENTWPDRFASSPDVAGTWDPWFFWAFGIWGLVLAVHALRTFSHRPPSEAEIERELDRLKASRR